ncbi:MAG: hypothetical protein AB7D51_10410, partial [Desulfovibrionaceae bacterium]
MLEREASREVASLPCGMIACMVLCNLQGRHSPVFAGGLLAVVVVVIGFAAVGMLAVRCMRIMPVLMGMLMAVPMRVSVVVPMHVPMRVLVLMFVSMHGTVGMLMLVNVPVAVLVLVLVGFALPVGMLVAVPVFSAHDILLGFAILTTGYLRWRWSQVEETGVEAPWQRRKHTAEGRTASLHCRPRGCF